jgi:hypothetical protein
MRAKLPVWMSFESSMNLLRQPLHMV